MGKEDVRKKSSEYAIYKPKKAVKLSKREYKVSKQALKRAKVRKEDKETIREAKTAVKIQKKVLKEQYKRNGGSGTQKVAKKGYVGGRNLSEASVSEHDVMGDIVGKRQAIRQSKYALKKNKQLVTSTAKAGTKLVKATYHIGNRGYNLARGNGFTRTLKEERWETKLANRIKQIRQRIARNKAMKASKTSYKVLKWATTPLRQILLNPLSLKSYIIAFVLVVIAAFYLGTPSTMQQDEFHLNDSWLHISKLDRLKSTDEVDYWTNIDEMLQYTNFVYQDYHQGTTWLDPDDDIKRRHEQATPGGNPRKYDKTMADMEYSLWYSLNRDKDHLKTMKDLYGKDSQSQWKLPKSDLKEFEELLEISKDTGYYISYQELENPIYKPQDGQTTDTLTITKRFGYISKDKIYPKTIFQVPKGKQLYATMPGKIYRSENDVTIETKQAKFIYYNVAEIRVKSGDTVIAGQEIAKVNAENGLEVRYQKLKKKNKKEKEWIDVNVGFYLPSVHYNQTTSVLSTLDLSGDMAVRVRQATDYVKKYEPKATVNGMSAMFGNFWTESLITAKRAEGDYLNPPIGASGNSWDDPAWLSLGGPSIYNGGYPNIIHRGLGLGQWTDTADGSTRHTMLLQYANLKAKKWYDLELQIDFIFNGDSPYYRQVAREILTSNESVETLTKRFLNQWEGNAGNKLLERQNNAKQIAAFLKQSPLGGGQIASFWNFPEVYRSKVTNPPTQASMTTQAGSGYPVGQCTWYAYNRLVELGTITDLSGTYGYLGNGQDWVRNLVAKGWRFSSTPQKGAVVSTAGGFDSTYPQFGHVGIVEYVNPDGTFLVSECNYLGRQDTIHWRVCQPAFYYTFAVYK